MDKTFTLTKYRQLRNELLSLKDKSRRKNPEQKTAANPEQKTAASPDPDPETNYQNRQANFQSQGDAADLTKSLFATPTISTPSQQKCSQDKILTIEEMINLSKQTPITNFSLFSSETSSPQNPDHRNFKDMNKSDWTKNVDSIMDEIPLEEISLNSSKPDCNEATDPTAPSNPATMLCDTVIYL